MNKVIVYGGSFNPCTLAHLNALQCAKTALKKDGGQVIGLFVPTGDKYIKSVKLDSKLRCDMIEAMIKDSGDDELALSTIEIDSAHQPRTIHTLRMLKQQLGECELYFLLGADKLAQFDRWYAAEAILEEFNLIVLNRTDKLNHLYDIDSILKKDIYQKHLHHIMVIENTDIRFLNVSSTAVRNRFWNDSREQLEKWISPSVYSYIEKNKIYIEYKEDIMLKAACGQIKVVPGKPSVNFASIKRMVAEAKAQHADLIAFPEMCVSGYILADKWCDEEFCSYVASFNERIKELSDGIGIIWGNIDQDERFNGRDGRHARLNTAFFAYNRKWCAHTEDSPLLQDGRQVKTLNPDYRIFDDSRYFLSTIEMAHQHSTHPEVEALIAPFIFCKNGKNYRIGLEICEDMWSKDYNTVNPTAVLCRKEADLIINISSSPWNLTKERSRQKRIAEQVKEAAEKFCPFLYINAAGMQNNGKNVLMFDGSSAVYDKEGNLLMRCRDDFEEDFKITDFTRQEVKKHEEHKLLSCLVHAIREFDEQQFAKKLKWVIGLSGGLDSSINAALLTIALGPKRIVGYNLATKYNSDLTKNNARVLADQLKIRLVNGSIEKIVQATVETCHLYGYEDEDITLLTYENIQARIRGHALSTFAQIENGVICNNGNKVEVALGYCTLYGDTIGCLSPIGDLTKVQLFDLAKQINAYFKQEVIPLNLLPEVAEDTIHWEMPPSAELKNAQRDPMKWFYHDWLITMITEYPGYRVEQILEMVLDGSIYDLEVGKWLRYYGLDKDPQAFIQDFEWVINLLSRSVFKRIQMPPIVMISRGSFGYDFRESQTAFEYTERYTLLKQQILAKERL